MITSRAIHAVLFTAVWLHSGTALAQADASTKAAAESLFDQGRELMAKGDFKAACGLLERSQQIDPAVGTLLYLGECYERSGRNASAWATFREAASAARAAGQFDRARTGEERAQRLAPGLSKLTIEVSEAARAVPGLVVLRDGQAVSTAVWNVPVAVDPGEYRVEASAPGYQTWSDTVKVADKAARASVVIPALTPQSPSAAGTAEAPPTAPAPTTATSTVLSEPAQPAPVTTSDGDGQRLAAYILGGVGVAGLGVGSFFGIRAIAKNEDAKEFCPRGNVCDDERGETLTDDANQAAVISNIAFGVGGAALAGAIVLYITAPSRHESPGLAAAVTPSGVWLKGAF